MSDFDLVLAGGGGAASLLLIALDRNGLHGMRIAVVDPVRRRGQDRTWAFWDQGVSDLDDVLSSSWSRVGVADTHGFRMLELAPLRYAMVRSAPVFARAAAAWRCLGPCRRGLAG